MVRQRPAPVIQEVFDVPANRQPQVPAVQVVGLPVDSVHRQSGGCVPDGQSDMGVVEDAIEVALEASQMGRVRGGEQLM